MIRIGQPLCQQRKIKQGLRHDLELGAFPRGFTAVEGPGGPVARLPHRQCARVLRGDRIAVALPRGQGGQR